MRRLWFFPLTLNWARMEKGMRSLAIVCEYWKAASKLKLRTTDKGE